MGQDLHVGGLGDGDVRFEGFGAGAVAWFEGIEADNSRARFAATKSTWEADVVGPLDALLEELAAGTDGGVKRFRQHRDVRFSKDKAPYKTTTYGIATVPGSECARYVQLSSAGLYAGTGMYDPAPDQLARYRVAAADAGAGADLERALAGAVGAGLEVGEPELKTAPRGIPRDHPRIGLLRRKTVIVGARLPPGPDLASRSALEHCLRTYECAAPVASWLDEHVGASTMTPEERFGQGRAGSARR